jgi:septum formation protein
MAGTDPRPPPLVLASSSPYRRELLERLGLPFSWAPPAFDETPLPGETADALVRRLARGKAESLAAAHPGALIIGSDQVAVLPEGTILNKPGGHAAAREQLRRSSGRRVDFLTGLCLLDARSAAARIEVVVSAVLFRTLDDAEIERYLASERPYDCAGAFKSERLGIALLREMHLPDPTALVGLPLIALSALLREAGVAVP